MLEEAGITRGLLHTMTAGGSQQSLLMILIMLIIAM
jgi:hypothetical protein